MDEIPQIRVERLVQLWLGRLQDVTHEHPQPVLDVVGMHASDSDNQGNSQPPEIRLPAVFTSFHSVSVHVRYCFSKTIRLTSNHELLVIEECVLID